MLFSSIFENKDQPRWTKFVDERHEEHYNYNYNYNIPSERVVPSKQILSFLEFL